METIGEKTDWVLYFLFKDQGANAKEHNIEDILKFGDFSARRTDAVDIFDDLKGKEFIKGKNPRLVRISSPGSKTIENDPGKYSYLESRYQNYIVRAIADYPTKVDEVANIRHCLSTEETDERLRTLGYENQGITGYILKAKKKGSIPLTAYYSTLNEMKFFFSAYPKKEDLETYFLKERDVVGYVEPKNMDAVVQLFRFRKMKDHKIGDHFYATAPLKEKLDNHGYKEDDPQGYIFREPREGRVPLYVYSTRKDELFFEPIEVKSAENSSRGIYVRGKSPTIIFQPTEPLLNVKELAQIFVDLIFTSIGSKDPQEQFYGIFGRWGRGKTYFWEQCKKQLSKKQYPKLETIDFHAWKYQDTPAVWAYLYEIIAENYYASTKWLLLKPVFAVINILQSSWLSIFRDINKPLLFLLGFFGIWYFGLPDALLPLNVDLVGFSVSIGIAAYGAVNFLKKPLVAEAKRFITEVGKRQSYKLHLGLQHEIQEELRALLKAWFFFRFRKSRLILFIDDIDRCSEGKIISIVDSIRVMLHDDYLQRHLIVVAAIDERILHHAIINKYQRVAKDEGGSNTTSISKEHLSREYMDKLFITGIKLGELTTSDKESVLDALHKGIVNPSSYRNRNETASSKDPANINELENPGPQPSDSPPMSPPNSPRVVKNIEDDFQLEIEEHSHLKELAIERDMTPRSIRVFSTRYRLGKQIIQTIVKSSPLLEEEWNDVSLGNRYRFAKMLIEKTYGEVSTPVESPINEILESVADMVTPYA